MAGKKNSAYARERESLMAYIRKQRSKGIEISIPIPATELELRKAGLKGAQITKEVNKIKNTRKHQKDLPAYDIENPKHTGTVGTLQEERRDTRKRQRKSKSEKIPAGTDFDVDFDMTTVAVSEHEAYVNFLNAVGVDIYETRRRWRSENTYHKSLDAQERILDMLKNAVSKHGGGYDGECIVGAIIMQAGEERLLQYIEIVLYDSDTERIEFALANIAIALAATLKEPLSQQDREAISEADIENETIEMEEDLL